ncbi:hypothetical protein V6N11_037914 [Hibiscus sabdariffa]|uniref:RanBP2-type domain-containing protein n=1 Tax=Hibiscus sabdariffa TaxID=183260 RepID=A0ABR2ADA3_9ROSI
MNRPGDWNCRSCQHLNFQRRDSCQRCGEPRSGGERGDYGSFGGRGGSSLGFTGPDVRPGDWYCTVGNCGAHNFASRSSCFKCGAAKDESSGGFEAPVALTGNLETGFAPGRDAMSTTLPAGWNVSDAMHQGTPPTNLHTNWSEMKFSFLGTGAVPGERSMRQGNLGQKLLSFCLSFFVLLVC